MFGISDPRETLNNSKGHDMARDKATRGGTWPFVIQQDKHIGINIYTTHQIGVLPNPNVTYLDFGLAQSPIDTVTYL